jgi:BirA family transcriptional regulator, biotin operon repressor / biotin---[acetyl-CoA-carboxylase] ligase
MIHDPIDASSLRAALSGSLFGINVRCFDLLESTNALARSMAGQDAPEGTIVVADEQSAGRGRMGREWLAQPGANLLFSVLLRPGVEPEQVFAITMIMAVSAVESLHRKAGVRAGIKWPNDVYVRHRKLAGILTEIDLKGSIVNHVVLGIGLNVNWHPDETGEIRAPATSLLLETGRAYRRADLLVWILEEFESGYRRFLKGELETFYSKWNELSLVLGRDVVIESGEERIYGKAVSIDRSGALILEEGNGTRRSIVSGDVSLRLE